MKKLLIFFAGCLMSLQLGAQGAYEPVYLKINSEDGVYAKGDSIRITAVVSEKAESTLVMKVLEYGRTISEKTISLPAGETLVYADAFDRATSRVIKIGPSSDPKAAPTSVGFLVSPEDFRPGFETPSDLRSYWDGQLAAMRKVRAKVKKGPAVDISPEEAAAFECYHIEINMPDGNPARGYIAYPKGAAKKSLPIYLFVHSAGINKIPRNHASVGTVIGFAKKGCIALDINAHGMLDNQDQAYYDALLEGELKNNVSADFTSDKDFYFHNMYLRDVRALDYAVTLPQWDGKRILVQGESQGGGQTLALCGIDTRVTHACATVPAMTDMGGILDSRKSGWPSGANSVHARTDIGKAVMPYHDGATLVSLFHGNLYIEAGNIDNTCDPAGISAAFNNAGAVSSKEIHFYPWRSHTKMDERNNKDWGIKVKSHRDKFIKAFFAGE